MFAKHVYTAMDSVQPCLPSLVCKFIIINMATLFRDFSVLHMLSNRLGPGSMYTHVDTVTIMARCANN